MWEAMKPQTDLRKAENCNHKMILPIITKFGNVLKEQCLNYMLLQDFFNPRGSIIPVKSAGELGQTTYLYNLSLYLSPAETQQTAYCSSFAPAELASGVGNLQGGGLDWPKSTEILFLKNVHQYKLLTGQKFTLAGIKFSTFTPN